MAEAVVRRIVRSTWPEYAGVVKFQYPVGFVGMVFRAPLSYVGHAVEIQFGIDISRWRREQSSSFEW